MHERWVRQYGERTAEIHQERQLRVRVQRDPLAIERALRLPGWRVYVINAWQERLSLEQAVLAYREEYLVEPNFGRLKGKPLSLTPMYLQNDQHATGLTRLLSLGSRVLALMEHGTRRQ